MAYQIDPRFFNDGCVVLYKINEEKAIWYYQPRISGFTNRYIRMSSRTTDFKSVKVKAVKECHKLCILHEEGLMLLLRRSKESLLKSWVIMKSVSLLELSQTVITVFKKL